MVFGFGLDIFDPVSTDATGCNVTPCLDSTFSFSLFDDQTLVGSASFTPTFSDTETSFFGIQSTLAFNTVQVRETTGTNDNEGFGNFVTTAAVPLPAPIILLLAALAGLAVAAHRKAT